MDNSKPNYFIVEDIVCLDHDIMKKYHNMLSKIQPVIIIRFFIDGKPFKENNTYMKHRFFNTHIMHATICWAKRKKCIFYDVKYEIKNVVHIKDCTYVVNLNRTIFLKAEVYNGK